MLASIDKQATNRIIFGLILAALLGWGIWLRWRFIQTVHLYPDEFVTLLAIKMIAEHGRPVLPSGLFYEHGLLFSYLASLGWLVDSSYLTVRYVSLLCGGLTLLLTFWVGRRWFSLPVALMATSGLAIAPMAIQWSGRARMYALLQLLVLLSLWLAYTGIHQNRARLRWAALLVYLGATLTHFVAVTLAPALVVGAMVLDRLGRGAEKQGSKGVGEIGRWGDREIGGERGERQGSFRALWAWGMELVALGLILVVAFLVKRAGQPKGIEAWQASVANAAAGFWQVFDIYSNFSLNPVEGWQAIAPFYLVLPAALFTPFAVVAMATSVALLFQTLTGKRTMAAADDNRPALFLSLILFIVTLEMILLVSPDRRDDKYLFMLLPVLLLLGAQGMIITTNRFLTIHQLPITNYQLPITSYLALIISALTLFSTWPRVQALLANTGDDYASAFAYVRDHWQEGDKILTGTPAAAAFFLGRNDFYSVQRRGGYDYRLLTVAGQAQPVDRWLASPAIRTEADLHRTLAGHEVWLILERWGLQREYYDLPFQQQLLAQTDYVTEVQGIFVLHSKPNPQPLALAPAHLIYAANSEIHPIFGEMVQLVGYTVEPEQARAGRPLRLTLYWQAVAAMPHDYTIFVHLRQVDGATVAQADHRPLGALYPTSLWPVGELIRESSELFLPAELSPGSYELWVGLYLLETGERLPLQADTSGENAVRLGSLTVKP